MNQKEPLPKDSIPVIDLTQFSIEELQGIMSFCVHQAVTYQGIIDFCQSDPTSIHSYAEKQSRWMFNHYKMNVASILAILEERYKCS